MKVGFIGCIEFSRVALKTILSIKNVTVVAVVTRSDSAVNSDFYDLSDICIENKIPYHYEDPKNRHHSVDFLKQYHPDVIYCFGWSYLLGKDVLNIPSKGVIGFHPAKLPQNRGRHPIIWALSLGLNETASTFFKMDEGADSGPILTQESIIIDKDDDASILYGKIKDVAVKQITSFTLDLANGTEIFVNQNHEEASYWRKRSRADGLVDWRMSAESIYNLVRALSQPYPGAEFILDGEFHKILKCEPVYNSLPRNIEPGHVLEKRQNSFLIKVSGTDAVWITTKNIDLSLIGEYL